MKSFNGNILKVAIENGCKTVRDLAEFIRVYNTQPLMVA